MSYISYWIWASFPINPFLINCVVWRSIFNFSDFSIISIIKNPKLIIPLQWYLHTDSIIYYYNKITNKKLILMVSFYILNCLNKYLNLSFKLFLFFKSVNLYFENGNKCFKSSRTPTRCKEGRGRNPSARCYIYQLYMKHLSRILFPMYLNE